MAFSTGYLLFKDLHTCFLRMRVQVVRILCAAFHLQQNQSCIDRESRAVPFVLWCVIFHNICSNCLQTLAVGSANEVHCHSLMSRNLRLEMKALNLYAWFWLLEFTRASSKSLSCDAHAITIIVTVFHCTLWSIKRMMRGLCKSPNNHAVQDKMGSCDWVVHWSPKSNPSVESECLSCRVQSVRAVLLLGRH